MSELLKKLIDSNILLTGIWETIYLTFISAFFAYLIGLPLGVLLSITDKNGIMPKKALNAILGIIVNIFRSIPFVILMVALLPVAKFITGTSLGNKAMIVTLVMAAAPYAARMAESSINEVNPGVIEAAQAMGVSTPGIIFKVLIPEAKPSLIKGTVISLVTILGYSAMAGTIGGGGLGMIAISYGYQRFENDVVWVCVVLTVLIVQIIEILGSIIEKKTDKRKA